MPVHLLHGCVRDWNSVDQSCRNFVSEAQLSRYLEQLPRKYERWRDDQVDPYVLSVDDSTKGGARACELARACGHEVVFFVNPYQIASGDPYFFVFLDALLDARREKQIQYEGLTYVLGDNTSLRSFRLAVRQYVCDLDQREVFPYLHDLAHRLRVHAPLIREHAQSLTIQDLTSLRTIGVMIDNHGWMHAEIGHLRDSEFAAHIDVAKQWLSSTMDIEANHYAVPFGLSFVPAARRALVSGTVFLAHPDLPEGKLPAGHWNRLEITAKLRALK
jgi:hypothetical protein